MKPKRSPFPVQISSYLTPIRQALRSRARKQRAARKPHLSDITTGGAGSVIENVAQTRKLAETTLDSSKSGSKILPDEERPTNTASGSNEEEDDNVGYVALHAWALGCFLSREDWPFVC